MSLEFTAKLPDDVPGSAPVFRLQPPEPGPTSAGLVAELSKRIGLPGRAHETCSADDWTMHQVGPWELGVHSRSGATVGRHRARYHRPGERTFELSDDEATGIATAFIERVELVALDEARPRGITHLKTAGGELSGEAQETTVIDAGVVIGRTIKEIAVEGPGGFAMVNVDSDGEVVGFRSIWRPLTDAVADVEIRPPDLAYESMERIASTVRGDIEVTKATFGYFEQGILDPQSFLQPAYALVYIVRDDEVAFRSAEVVAAAERLFEPLIGAKRFGDRRQTERGGPVARRG
jgi:hypothetical protein